MYNYENQKISLANWIFFELWIFKLFGLFNSSLTDAFDTCRHLTCELSKSSEMSNLLLQAKYCINSQTTWMVQPPLPLLSGFMHIIVEYLIFSVILTKTSRLCVFDRPSMVPRLLIIFWSYYWSFGYHEFKIDVIYTNSPIKNHYISCHHGIKL